MIRTHSAFAKLGVRALAGLAALALLTLAPAAAQASETPAGVKPIIRGLIDRQAVPSARMLAAVKAYVVKVNWADLQPTQNGPLAANNAIDQAIALVRQPDMLAAGVVLKLRVFTGAQAARVHRSPSSRLGQSAGWPRDELGQL